MTLNNIPRNISYEFDKNNNLVLKPKDETKVSSYDISRHDQPIADMTFADGSKVLIFKALGITEGDCNIQEIWLQKERKHCISIEGEYKFRDHLDFENKVKVLYESRLDVREVVDPKEYQIVHYEIKHGLLYLYFYYDDEKHDFEFGKF